MKDLRIATVHDVADPQGQHRVRVSFAGDEIEHYWARCLSPYATADAGWSVLPEVGDEVVVAFLTPQDPVVLGSLHSSGRCPPLSPDPENNRKLFRSRSGLEIEIDEDRRRLTLGTPGQNRIRLDDSEQSVRIEDQHGNRIELGPDGISITSARDIRISADGDVAIDGQNVSIDAKLAAALTAVNASIDAMAQLKLRAHASAELVASGQTAVGGALVMIN